MSIQLDPALKPAHLADEEVEITSSAPHPHALTSPVVPTIAKNVLALNPLTVAPKLESKETQVINALGDYLHNQAPEMLFGACTKECYNTCKKQLDILLEPCKAILNPPALLQFYRHFVQQLLSDKTSFEWQMEVPPTLLPLPLSLTWIPHMPYTVSIANPMLRTLFSGALVPNEHQQFYVNFLSRHLSSSIALGQKKTHTITFQQFKSIYEFTLVPAAITLLFFPQFAAQIAHNMQEKTKLAALFTPLIFSPYTFSRSDCRSLSPSFGRTSIIESLINSDALSSFPIDLMQAPRFKEKLLSYLAFLIRHAILDNEIMLPDELVLNIFRIASLVIEEKKPPYESDKECANFYYYFYTACQQPRIQKLVATLSYLQKLQPLPPPLNQEEHEKKKDFYLTSVPEDSFLLQDLLCSWTNQKGSKIRTNAPTPQIAGLSHYFTEISALSASLCESMAVTMKGVHLVVFDPKKTTGAILRDQLIASCFYQAMQEAWTIAQKKLDTEALGKLFTPFLIANDSALTIFHLRLLPLLNQEVVRNAYMQCKFATTSRYAPSGTATAYISTLLNTNPLATHTITKAILAAAEAILPHIHPELLKKNDYLNQYHEPNHPMHSFAEHIHRLIEACKKKEDGSKIRSLLSYSMNIHGMHAGKTMHRELFYIQFLFAGLLASIRFDTPQPLLKESFPSESWLRFLDFSKDQINTALKETNVAEALLKAEDTPYKPHIVLVESSALKTHEIIRATGKKFASIKFYGNDFSLSDTSKESLLALLCQSKSWS